MVSSESLYWWKVAGGQWRRQNYHSNNFLMLDHVVCSFWCFFSLAVGCFCLFLVSSLSITAVLEEVNLCAASSSLSLKKKYMHCVNVQNAYQIHYFIEFFLHDFLFDLVARHFEKVFGCMRVSLGEALRWVLDNVAHTDLAEQIQKHLRSGSTVPDALAVQALEIVLMTSHVQTRGWVYCP